MFKSLKSPIGSISITRYPNGLPNDFDGMSLKSCLRMTMERYPLEVKYSKDFQQVKIRCDGADIAQQSFHMLIRLWCRRLVNPNLKGAFPRPTTIPEGFCSLDLKVCDTVFKDVCPAEWTPDKEGWFSFDFSEVETF